jgi:hypothetical protein
VPLTPNAIKYTLKQLLTTALPAIGWHITQIDEQGAEIMLFNDNKLYFKLLTENKRKQLLEGNLTPFYTFSFDEQTQIPLFPIEQTEDFYKREENSITFTHDLLTLPFLLLSNYDNQQVNTRDRHDRQTFKNSYNERYNAINFPLVDHYALLIRKTVTENFPDIIIEKRASKLVVTHDIDELYRFSNLYKTVKTIFGGDLWKRKKLKFFLQSVKQLFSTLQNRINDPYITGLQQLIERVQELHRDDIEQIVFIKSLKTGEPDATYDINDPILAQLINYLTKKGVKIGLHGGYYAYNNPEIYRQEWARLAALLQQPVIAGRQHFLRYHRMKTLHVWQENHLKHDYTLGFAEREGFRCGTCHPYPLYDIENDSVSNIIEHPLIAMDGTFFQYQHNTPEATCRKMQQLHKACRQVEGDFVILWHNTVVYREFEELEREVFSKVIRDKE